MPVHRTQEAKGVPPEIQSRLEAAGLRRTLNTRAVLGLFLARPGVSLSHGQALGTLTARGLDINRVTLYRLLDRLAACGVLQRHADADRTWRFRLGELGERTMETVALPEFACDACHRKVPLPALADIAQSMTRDLFLALARLGYQGHRMDVSIHGTCAACLAQGGAAGPAA